VSPLRAIVILCGVLALSSCGSSSTSSRPAGEKPQSTTSAAIEAIDEPSPDSFWFDPPDDGATSSEVMCLGDDAKPTSDRDACEPPPGLKDELRKQEEQFRQAIKPAKGIEPRAVAQLRLADRDPKARARLVVWRSQAGKLCLVSEVETKDGGGDDGPFGPCIPEPRCDKICLDLWEDGSGLRTRYLVSGVLASEGDRLRMTLDSGRVIIYALSGPFVPGFADYRVFMLDLGRDLYERLELLHGDKVVAEEKKSHSEIEGMRCFERFPIEEMPSSRAEIERSPLNQCLRKAGSQ
jgi:hypothetical protein